MGQSKKHLEISISHIGMIAEIDTYGRRAILVFQIRIVTVQTICRKNVVGRQTPRDGFWRI
jgi:hypothetical protein